METPFTIETHTLDHARSVHVIRDDLVVGGTKVRGLLPYIRASTQSEFIYAGPAYGYAQVAVARVCKDIGRRATLFVAKRNALHPNTALAESLGAKIIQVPYGYLVVVKKRASDYCAECSNERCLLPWGLKCDAYTNHLIELLRAFEHDAAVCWVCVGSGTLFECLAAAQPTWRFKLVRIGAEYAVPDVLKARVVAYYTAPEAYADRATVKPPYPSNLWYDAKTWRFVLQHACDGELVWNVGA